MRRIGDYTLQDALGRGGMARVWRAQHVHTGVSVALKVLEPRVATPRAVDAFLLEVRAMARLRHPHVAWIHDHGVIEDDPELAGSPWLATELCSGGDLYQTRDRITSWTALHDVLVKLLEALSHAHAAGVLHRDLKLTNVLFATDRDLRPGLKLADFGIASVAGERSGRFGTPLYMPPEIDEPVRHGPPVDLFALGVLAWRLATGRWPYPESPVQLVRKARETYEPFQPRFAVPEGLEGWLKTLLRADPGRRPQSAGDARAILPEPGVAWAPPPDRPPPRPIPGALEIGDPVLPSPVLGRAGATLLDERHLPLLARHAERAQLWQMAVDTERTGTPAFVALTGPSGVGHTALATWFVRTLRERSGARVILQERAERPGIAVLSSMLAEILDVPDDADWADIADAFPELRTALLQVAAGHLDLLPGAVVAALRWAARRQTVVLWLDGAPDPSLSDVFTIARRQLEGPVIVGLSGVTEAPEGMVDVPLGPLGISELGAALRHLAPLESDAAAAIAAECGGMPATATRLVRRAHRLGALEPGRTGHLRLSRSLARDEDATLDLTPRQWAVLECAAAYGARVRRWGVASVSRAPWSELLAVQEKLETLGWLTPQGDAWILSPAVRQLALARPDAPRWARLWADHLDQDDDPLVRIDCLVRAGDAEAAARICLDERGRILELHGTLAEAAAIRQCLEGLERVRTRPELHGALWAREINSLSEQDDYTALARSRAEQARARGWNEVAAACLFHGAFLQATPTKEALLLEALALAPDATLVRGKILHSLAFLHARLNREGWRDEVAEALAILRGLDGEEARAHQLALERWMARVDGDLDRALALAKQVLAHVRDGDPGSLDFHLALLADIELRRGQLDAAASYLREALEIAELTTGGTRIAIVLGNLMVIAGKRQQWSEVGRLIVRLEASTRNPHLLGIARIHRLLACLGTGDTDAAGAILPTVRAYLDAPHESEMDAVEALELASELASGPIRTTLAELAARERARARV
ncbi:MAG: protein kinase [Alphaproteobacteria bacterium]|nr:protein kinase [Alphaproteobacteria bacterium]